MDGELRLEPLLDIVRRKASRLVEGSPCQLDVAKPHSVQGKLYMPDRQIGRLADRRQRVVYAVGISAVG